MLIRCIECNELISDKNCDCPMCARKMNETEQLIDYMLVPIKALGNKTIFTEREMIYLRTATKDVISQAIVLMCYYGLTIDEMYRMKRSDIELYENGVIIRSIDNNQIITRKLPFLAFTWPVFNNLYWGAAVFKSEYIMCKRNGEHMSKDDIKKGIKIQLAALGGNHKIPDIRKQFIRNCKCSDVDGDVINYYLGHFDKLEGRQLDQMFIWKEIEKV